VGRCAELCGTYHAFMNFEVRAVTPAQFQAYMSARERGLDTHDALVSIGLPGDATATHPFNLTKGYQQAPNPNGITDTSTSGTGS
jgi:cytochrome c oxidase subunit 2